MNESQKQKKERKKRTIKFETYMRRQPFGMIKYIVVVSIFLLPLQLLNHGCFSSDRTVGRQATFITYLTHVGDVKHPCLVIPTTPQMLFHDTPIFPLVQDRKFVSSERNHIPTQLFVQVIQLGLDQVFTGRKGSLRAGRKTKLAKNSRGSSQSRSGHGGLVV
jgi:hypothetical protein